MLKLSLFGTVTYLELQVSCLSILLYLFISTLLYDKKIGAKTNFNIIALFVSCLIIIISDASWAMLEYSGKLPIWTSYLVNMIYFLATTIAPYFWFIYQEEEGETKLSKNILGRIIMLIPIVLVSVLIITAPINHLCFFINEAGEYERGDLHYVTMLTNFAYLVGACIRAGLRAYFAKEKLSRKMNVTMALYPIAIILFGIAQAFTGYAFNCVGFTISLYIYYINLVKGKEIQNLEFENILNDDYDAVFMVDGESDIFRTLRVSKSYADDVKRSFKTGRYSQRVNDDIAEDIVNDKKGFMETFACENVLNRLKKDGFFYYDYLINTKQNEPVYYRAKFCKASSMSEDAFVIGIKNINEEIRTKLELEERKREEEKVLSIIKNLSNDFECLDYVRVQERKEDDTSTSYRTSEEISKYIPRFNTEKSITKKYDLLMEYCVDDEDKENFYNFSRREMILLHLKKDPAYYIDFKVKFGDKKHYYQLKYAAVETDEDGNIKGFISGLRNIDREVMVRQDLIRLEEAYSQQKAFIKLFVDNYSSAYYVDLENDTYIAYKHNRHFEDIPQNGDFSKSMEKYIDAYVLESDKEKVREICRKKNIVDNLAKKNEISVVYTDARDGNRFYKMQVIRGTDDQHVAVGFLDVNEEYLKEQAIQKQLEKQVEERTHELRENNKRISKMNFGIMELMGNMVESRDAISGEHINRVKFYTKVLAKQIMIDYPEYGIDEEKLMVMTNASPLHDVGKIAIPDSILQKPGKLTPEEWEVMKTHCEKGAEFLDGMKDYWDSEYLKVSTDICLYHHERWDGNGYPYGLKGEEIPISAQIISIADCFDALTSKRPYKDKVAGTTAMEMINNGECGQFSEKILASLNKCEEEFIRFAKQ